MHAIVVSVSLFSQLALCDMKDIIKNDRHDSGRIRGYAHIDFLNEDKATKGLERDGHMMGTRCVHHYYPPLPHGRIVRGEVSSSIY